jgi:hypothetical protein
MILLESIEFILLSGCEVVELPELVPAKRGVYLLFLAGGQKLLERTGYFRTESKEPLSTDDQVHVYTGAAGDLRRRLLQHFVGDVRRSNLRKTLFAIERAKQAVSRTGTPRCHVTDEKSLGHWLYRNALVAVGCTNDPFGSERALLSRFSSPLNIRADRASAYSQALMGWREAAFPTRSSPRRLPQIIPPTPSSRRRNIAIN